MLDMASEKIEGRFKNQPLVEAGIRMTLTRTYHALGDYAAMVHHGKRALELYRHLLGETNAATLGAMLRPRRCVSAQGPRRQMP